MADWPPSAGPNVHIQSYWRFRDLLEAAPDGILEVERDGTIVLMNAAAERIFGYKREELLGQYIEVLVPESLKRRHIGHRTEYAENPVTRPMGTGLELFARRKDGSNLPVEISLSPIRSPQGSRVIAIVRDISNRKQAEAQINAMHQEFTAELAAKNQQLEIRNREIERANRLKSEFLASMSHELRTPLHTIIGFADLLAEGLKGTLNPDQKRFVGHIQRDARHLLELINDVLDLSKIEAGHLELHPETFNAADVAGETIDNLRPQAVGKQITFVESFDANVMITADRVRLKEILYNLVSNAIKFTPEKGQITVVCSEQTDGVFFAVTDTGIGIDPAEHQAIFDKFYQVGSTTRGIREGTGLGLAITKSLIEMHGGKIWVESTPGQGSRFQFVFPRAESVSHAETAVEPDHRSERVVLVGMGQADEDVSAFLKQKGYDVVASEAEQLVATCRTLRPVAVVLDLPTPGAESWRVLQDIRAHDDTAQIPILALATDQNQSTLVSLGANAVVPKPVDPALLVEKLSNVIRRLPGEPPRILLVDDDAEARELLHETLRSAGLLTVSAAGGKQALEILARSPISAVIVDLVMPEMSGIELILRMRQNPAFAQLPVIVLTAKEMDLNDIEVVGRHASAVFLKAVPWKKDFLTQLYELLQQVTKA
ncbi:MAG: response regulator [Acidobacteriaceae bacterium]|nr:response regulator [Acidobacteriaceae bacterium]MBV8572410.1 response regulator [Acidobacteriaceae bacterium]